MAQTVNSAIGSPIHISHNPKLAEDLDKFLEQYLVLIDQYQYLQRRLSELLSSVWTIFGVERAKMRS